jgi:hypothetical protein
MKRSVSGKGWNANAKANGKPRVKVALLLSVLLSWTTEMGDGME